MWCSDAHRKLSFVIRIRFKFLVYVLNRLQFIRYILNKKTYSNMKKKIFFHMCSAVTTSAHNVLTAGSFYIYWAETDGIRHRHTQKYIKFLRYKCLGIGSRLAGWILNCTFRLPVDYFFHIGITYIHNVYNIQSEFVHTGFIS